MGSIRFRGKTLKERGMLAAGSWVTGGYYMDDCYGGCPEGKHYIVTWNSAGPGGFTDLIQVDRETVGQYTGLRDKNGRAICEGDILRTFKGDFVFKWEGYQFILDGFYCGSNDIPSDYFSEQGQDEVIGNIYDEREQIVDAA